MDNNEIAKRLRLHEQSALEEVIQEYTPYVSTIIYNVTKGCMSVSDIFQNFIRILTREKYTYSHSL